MSDSWRIRPIESLCSKVTSGGTPRRMVDGFYLPPGEGTPWVKSKELRDNVLGDAEEWISDRALAESSAKLLPKDTILVAMYGGFPTVGKLGIVATPMACNQAVCALIIDPDEADYRFVFYRLKADRSRLEALANGAAQQNISGRLIRQFPVLVPSVGEQRRIAEVLGALDDLIDTNDRQIMRIRTLNSELYRRALTQEEPRLCPFLDVFAVEFGGAFKGAFFTDAGVGMPLLRIRDLKTASPNTWTTERLPNEVLVSAGDILFGMDAEFRASQWVGPLALLNQRVCRVSARVESNAFAIEALKAPLAYIEGHKTGTTVIHLNKRDIEETMVMVPSEAAAAEFDSVAEPLRLWSVALSAENEQLRRTRDELLPLLMSGALRVRPEGVEA